MSSFREIDVPSHVDYEPMRVALHRVVDEGEIEIEMGTLSRVHPDGLGLPESVR